jgi:hypothetical protein
MKAITSKGEIAQLIASITRHSLELEKQFNLEATLGASEHRLILSCETLIGPISDTAGGLKGSQSYSMFYQLHKFTSILNTIRPVLCLPIDTMLSTGRNDGTIF